MASKHDVLFGKWKVREQVLVEELDRKIALEMEHRGEVGALNKTNRYLNDEIKRVSHTAEQREFRLTKKLEDQIVGAKTIQQEVDEQCDRLQDERDTMQAEMNRALELYDQQHQVSKKLTGENQHLVGENQHFQALDQQRKHDFADWQADRRDLENALATTSKLSDENMVLTQQLRRAQTEADQLVS